MENKNNNELPSKDLFELTALYICRNKKSWRIIDDLYNKNYDICVEIAEEARLKFKGILKEREIIEIECYINRLTALMLLDEQNGNQDNIMHILKSVYRKAFNYVVSVDKVKVGSYWKKHLKGCNSTTKVCSEITALLYIASNLEKSVDTAEYEYRVVTLMFPKINTAKTDDQGIPGAFYRECDKERRQLIDKLETNIRLKHFNQYTYDKILVGSNDENSIYKKLETLEVYSLTTNYMNIGPMLNGIQANRDEVRDMIGMYLEVYETYSNEIHSIDDVNMDELITILYSFLIKKFYVTLYENTREFFFDNYHEDTSIRQKKIIEESRSVKKKNLLLIDENEFLKLEVETLKRQLNKANKEINTLSANNKELFELRSYIFNNQDECEIETLNNNCDISFLNGKKVVCFGGTNAWVNSMSAQLEWDFIPAENINFDTAILNNADVVIIKATYISHGMYYKIIANTPDNADIKFINGSNINKIKYELSNYNN